MNANIFGVGAPNPWQIRFAESIEKSKREDPVPDPSISIRVYWRPIADASLVQVSFLTNRIDGCYHPAFRVG